VALWQKKETIWKDGFCLNVPTYIKFESSDFSAQSFHVFIHT
jgi:hypothetical protein